MLRTKVRAPHPARSPFKNTRPSIVSTTIPQCGTANVMEEREMCFGWRKPRAALSDSLALAYYGVTLSGLGGKRS